MPLDPEPFKSLHEAPGACWFSIFLGSSDIPGIVLDYPLLVHDTSVFFGNLVEMRIFLGSTTQKCERMRESPFENQTGPKKSLLKKNFKTNHSLNLLEGFRDQEVVVWHWNSGISELLS